MRENSLDAVADRDFVVELAAALAPVPSTSPGWRRSWCSGTRGEFGFIELDDSVATGSSIMPQKKNPDVAELVRGKTGRVFGNLQSLLTMMKGLPLAYNSDMQEDKERVFDSLDTAGACLAAMTVLLRNCRFRVDRMLAATRGDFSTATDLADHLALKGLPFREAHEVVGRVVRWCEEQERDLESLAGTELEDFHALFRDAGDITSVAASVRSRCSPGGTAPHEVRRQLALAETLIGSEGT